MSADVTDPVRHLAHDHGDLNTRVLAIGARVRAVPDGVGTGDALAGALAELREQLFLHFAREEEGLFPFVAEIFPELSGRMSEMVITHDTICGALARMCDLAVRGDAISMLRALFDRFESSYTEHAGAEAELLRDLDQQLDPSQRRRLAELLARL